MIGIPGLAQMTDAVATAFKSTWAQMTELFLIEHDEDGKHTDVTAHSVIVAANTDTGATGVVTADGDVTAQSADTISKCRMGEIQDLLTGTGVTSGLHLGGTKGWVLGLRLAGTPGTNTDYELRLFDLNHLVAGQSVLRLFYYTANGFWTLGVEAGGLLALGEDAATKRLSEVNTILARASTGYYERSRTAAMGDWTAYTPTWTTGAVAVTVGASSVLGFYAEVGHTVLFRVAITFGAGFSFGAAGVMLIGFPNTAVADGSQLVVGGAFLADTTVLNYPARQAIVASSTAFAIYDTAGNSASDAFPFAWGVGDGIFVQGSYEKA